MRISYVLALILGLSLTLSSCSKKQKEPESEEETTAEDIDRSVDEGIASMKDALGQLEKQLENAAGGEKVEPVDFRDLKAELPERINGMNRTSAEGERSGWRGLSISTAKGEYEDGDRRMEISILDAGGMLGLAKVGLAAWSQAEVDRESDDGYERTTTIDGYQAYEKYNNKTRDGQVSVIINERFIVNVEGDNISPRDLKSALGKLDLKKLERMGK